MTRHQIGSVLAVAGLLAIGLATLGPVTLTPPVEDVPTLCVLCGEFGAVDFLLNIALFVPFGLGLALMGVSVWRSALTVVLTTLGIESLQATVILGRDASLGDLLANTIGGLLGAMAPVWCRTLARPRRPTARVLTLTTLVVSVLLAALPVTLFRPAAAPTDTWWGQHAHEFGGTSQFQGRVVAVTLNGRPIGDGVLPDQARIRAAFDSLPLEFAASVVTGPIPPRPAQVAAIADGAGGWVAAIWQDGPDAIVDLRLRTANLLLRAPIVVVRRVLASEGVPVRLSVSADRRALTGTGSAEGQQPVRVTIPLTTTHGWILAWPWDARFDRNPAVRTIIWLVIWYASTGFLAIWWGGIAGWSLMAPTMVAGIACVALVAIPAATGTLAAAWWEWIAAFIGIGAGLIAGFRANRAASTKRSI